MKITKAFVYSVLFIIATQGQAASDKELDKIIARSKINKEHLGLIVQKATNGDTIYRHRSAQGMTPASLTKILTAATALEVLGPTRTVMTQLLATEKPVKGVLKGPLILKGGGDPGFVSETMWVLVNNFSRTEITKIEGDIWVDESLFDGKTTDESRESIRVDRAYDAPVSAMSFNWNSVNVFARPGENIGDKLKIFADPLNKYVSVVNKTKTGRNGAGKSIEVSRVTSAGRDTVEVAGQLGADHAEAVVYKNITSPALWAGHNLQQFLLEKGITVTGTIKIQKAPSSAIELASVESQPVSKMVTDMLKFSNNFVAEMLTKLLSVERGLTPGSVSGGVSVIQTTLSKIGLPSDKYKLVSPSGLTRDNQFTAEQLNLLLQHVYHNFAVGPEFLSALPVSGRDGTLKTRIKGKASGWVRAKTGLLNSVVGLAGFAGNPDGTVYSFTFIFNGPENEAHVRDTFDELAESLTR